MKINALRSLFTLIFVLLFTSGCSNLKDQWPDQMPKRSLFLKAYHADTENKQIQTREEYLLWIQRFYLGWEIYRNGWLKVTNQLLEETTNQQDRKIIEKKMQQIGFKISCEWAKKNKHRQIFTRHVSIWGNALLESLDRNEPLTLIDKVNADVDALLLHQLHPKAITENRYYAQDENNPFL